MNNTPKCPGCGADMELMHLCNAAFCYVCTKCGWDSPIGVPNGDAPRRAGTTWLLDYSYAARRLYILQNCV